MKDYLIIKDRGAALIITMMVLVMLNIIGLAAISTTSTEISIAGNERMNAQALQAAEAGIKEVIYRMGLTDDNTVTIANGGSRTTINGMPNNNAYIGDNGQTTGTIGAVACTSTNPCPGPDWEYKVFFTDNPTSGGPYTATATILPSTEWSSVNYSATAEDTALTVRYMTENNLGVDQNGDGDRDDIVYYDTTTKTRIVNMTNPTDGVADVIPPATLPKDYAIMLITSIGRSGSARKTVTVEVTSFPIDIDVDGAVTANLMVDMTGSSFVSGFNHMANTTRNDKTNTKTDFTNPFPTANGRDNWNRGSADETQAEVSNNADYSGKWEDTGHKPGAITTTGKQIKTAGSNETWGGDNSTDWGVEGGLTSFPSLAEMLGVDQAILDKILNNANVQDPSRPAQGVTWIQNAGGQDYTPVGSSGWGLMVVEGNFKCQANYEFEGLIYVKGNASIRGSFWLLGAMAVGGETGLMKLAAGNPTILYSQGAIEENVMSALKSIGYTFTTLSWKEGES